VSSILDILNSNKCHTRYWYSDSASASNTETFCTVSGMQ